MPSPNNNNNNHHHNHNHNPTAHSNAMNNTHDDNHNQNNPTTVTDDNNHNHNHNNLESPTASRFLAHRLSRIEPSRGVCSTVQTILNAHLFLLFENAPQHNNTNTNTSNNSGDAPNFFFSEPLLCSYYGYYDEPETPIHPALEYETGHLLVVVPEVVDEEEAQTNKHGSSSQMTVETTPLLRGVLEDDNNNHNRGSRILSEPFKRAIPSLKLKLSLLGLVLAGSSNLITAKLQSIPMYNYPIFLNLLHTFLAIPVAFILAYWIGWKVAATKEQQQQQHSSPPPVDVFVDTPPVLSNNNMNNMNNNMNTTPRRRTTTTIIHFSRFVLVSALDAITTTFQVLATVYLPGPLLALLPPAAATVMLHILSLARNKSHRGFHPCLHFWNQRTTSSSFVVIGLILVLGGMIMVLIPVLTSRHAPEYYCEATTHHNNHHHYHKNHVTTTDSSCMVCRQATTEELCKQQQNTERFMWEVDTTTTDDNIIHNQTDDNNNNNNNDDVICEWIPFEESSKEREFEMIVWSLVLILSTVPMVLSSIFKQRLARATNTTTTTTTTTINTTITTTVQQQVPPLDLSSPLLIPDDDDSNNNPSTTTTTTSNNNLNHPPEPLLHPSLQAILDKPHYWNAWIATLQFLFTIALTVPAYLLLSATNQTGDSVTAVAEELMLGDADDMIDGGGHFISSNNVLLESIRNGWLCYAAGIDSIESGCHPDTMCSSHEAFWSVNLHILSNAFYMTSLLLVLKYIGEIEETQAGGGGGGMPSVTHNNNQSNNENNESNVEEANSDYHILEMEDNADEDRNASDDEERGTEDDDETNVSDNDNNKSRKSSNTHRLLFVALIVTIPIADMLFCSLPRFLWGNDYVVASPVEHGAQGPSAISWVENLSSLLAIVIGLLLMHINRFVTPTRRRSLERDDEDSNDNNNGGDTAMEDPFSTTADFFSPSDAAYVAYGDLTDEELLDDSLPYTLFGGSVSSTANTVSVHNNGGGGGFHSRRNSRDKPFDPLLLHAGFDTPRRNSREKPFDPRVLRGAGGMSDLISLDSNAKGSSISPRRKSRRAMHSRSHSHIEYRRLHSLPTQKEESMDTNNHDNDLTADNHLRATGKRHVRRHTTIDQHSQLLPFAADVFMRDDGEPRIPLILTGDV